MADTFCPSRKDEQYRELADVLGSPEMAHLVWNRNGGNALDFDPKGSKSALFEQLLDYTDNDRFATIRLKAQYYLENNPSGEWYRFSDPIEPTFVNPEFPWSGFITMLSEKLGYSWDFAKEGELPEGIAGGFRLSGKNPVVIIDRDSFSTGNIVHEFGHLFIGHIKRDNPELYNSLLKEFNDMGEAFKERMWASINEEYKGYPDKAKEDELLTFLLEEYSKGLIEEKTGMFSALGKLWEYIQSLIADVFGIVDISKVTPNLSLKDLANMLVDPNIKLKLGDKFGSGEFLENFGGQYDFTIPYKKKVTDIEVPADLTPKDIVKKFMDLSAEVSEETDEKLAKEKGHYYWQADDGQKHYLTGVTRRMKKYGYGFFGEEDPDNVHIRRGKLIHGELENIQNEVLADLSDKYGMKLSDKAKKELTAIFKKLKGKHTALSEVVIMDKKTGLVAKPDLILISDTGKIMVFDFKTKFRKYTIDRDGVKKLKRSSFEWWTKGNDRGFSDKDKAHLQVSMYGHMIEKVLGLQVASISILKLDAITEDEKVITSIEAYTESEVADEESYFDNKGDVKFHNATERVYYGDEAMLHNKRLENLERERNENEEEAFVRLASGTESLGGTLLEELKKDLSKRLQFAKKRYDFDKKVKLENVIKLVEEEESASNAINEIIAYSYEEVIEIVEQVDNFIKEKKNFTPGLLYRWSDAVQAFKNLKLIKDALYDNPELLPSKKYIIALDTVLDQINRLESLYKTEGRYLIAKWLTPYYNGIKVKFQDTYKAEYRKLKYRLIKKGKQSLSEFESEHGSINEYVKKRIDNKTIEKDTFNLLYKELEIASRDVSEMTRWIDNMLDTSDPIAAALVNAFTQAEEKSRLEAIDKREDMLDMLEELQLKNHKHMNTSSERFYGFMLEHNDKGVETQFILRPYKSDFFADVEEERKKERGTHSKAETNAAVSEFKKKFRKFNDDTFREAMTEKLKDMFTNEEITKEEFNYVYEELATAEVFYISKLKGNEKIREEVVNKLSYWFNKNNPLFFEYDEKYINPEWAKFMDLVGIDKKLSMFKQMEELRKSDNIYARYYTFIENVSREANQMIPYGYRIYDRLPGVGKMNSERFKSGMNPLTMVKENLKGDFFVRPDDLERGNQEYTNEFGRTRYYIPIHYTNKIEPKDQSYDITGIYFKFWESANDFRNKREILPELEMTRFFINSRKAYKRNVFSDIMRKNAAGDDDQVAALKDTTVLSAMFNDWFEMALYGKMSKDLKDPIKINDTLAFDPMKFVDAINRYTSLNLLGLNVVQGFANIAMGEMMQTIEAIAHEYVDPKTYAKALVKYDQYLPGVIADIGKTIPNSFGGLIYQEFNVLDNKATDVTFSRNSALGHIYDNSSAFVMQKSGEHWLQNRFLLAMMMKKQMVDLNGKSIGTLLEQYVKVGNKVQLKQQASMTAEEFQKFLKKNDWTETDQMAFKIKIKGILSRMHGEYSDLGRVAIQRLALGRMAYMFRKFVMPGFRRRWGRTQYIERLGQTVEGNYITFLKFFRNYYKEIFTLKFAMMGENWAALSDHEKANIRRTLSEAAFLTAAIILAGVAFSMKGEDDDDEWFWSFMSYQAYRLKTEILFFVSPGNAMQILRSPMASMSLAENLSRLGRQLTNPTELYQRGPMKGEYKLKKNFIDLIPFYKQFYRLRDIEEQIGWFRNI